MKNAPAIQPGAFSLLLSPSPAPFYFGATCRPLPAADQIEGQFLMSSCNQAIHALLLNCSREARRNLVHLPEIIVYPEVVPIHVIYGEPQIHVLATSNQLVEIWKRK